MRTFALLLFTLSFISLSGQDTVPAPKKARRHFIKNLQHDSVIPAGRNEIYLNIAPVFATMLGAYPGYEANYSLFYKRVLKNQRTALRTGFSFRPETNYDSFFYDSYNDWYFDQTDSTRTVNKFQRGATNKFQLNVGLERRSKGNKRWSVYAGADVIAGYYSRYYYLADYHEKLDTNGQWRFDDITFLDYERSHNFYAGVSPKCGLRYAFSPRWMMCLQTGFNVVVSTNDYYNRNAMGTGITKHEGTSFDFNMTGLLEEFSVVFRF